MKWAEIPSTVTLTRCWNFVDVHADSYVHVVELSGEAVFSDNCFSLLPGETRRITFREPAEREITVTAYTI